MNKRSINFVTLTVSFVVLAAALLASPARVHAQKNKIDAVREKIEVLLREAEKLRSKGATDKAVQLVSQAEELKAKLAKTKQRPRKKSGGNLGEVIHGLKAGAASLRALKRNDEAEKLERLAAELQKKSAHGQADAESRKKMALKRLAERKENAAAGEKRRQGGNEREVAMQQIKIMRLAQQGLLDADRKDLADMLKHSIHAQELALEGVRNEKATQVYKTASSLGQRVELLMFATQTLRDAGKKEHASSVGRLGEQLLKRFRAQQKQGGKGAKREGQRKGTHLFFIHKYPTFYSILACHLCQVDKTREVLIPAHVNLRYVHKNNIY